MVEEAGKHDVMRARRLMHRLGVFTDYEIYHFF